MKLGVLFFKFMIYLQYFICDFSIKVFLVKPHTSHQYNKIGFITFSNISNWQSKERLCCLRFEITPYIALTALLYCSPFPYFCAQNIKCVSKLKLCFKSRNLHHSWFVFHKNGKVFSENFWLEYIIFSSYAIPFRPSSSHRAVRPTVHKQYLVPPYENAIYVTYRAIIGDI